jgi:hypothetical protein
MYERTNSLSVTILATDFKIVFLEILSFFILCKGTNSSLNLHIFFVFAPGWWFGGNIAANVTACCCAGIIILSSPELKPIDILKLKLYSFAGIYS